MAQLIFLCPYENKPIATEIMLDPQSAACAGDYPISVFCPHCGFHHHGTIADGQLIADMAQADIVEIG
jgi:hypothetical protein